MVRNSTGINENISSLLKESFQTVSYSLTDGDLATPTLPGMGLEHGIPDHLKPKEGMDKSWHKKLILKT